jgi:hypothetical protein
MNSDERILKALEDLQAGQKTLQTDVASIKDIQQKQGERLEALEAGQKELHGKVDNVELKAEAIHDYQQKAHGEMMGIMHDITEINGQEQKALEKRIEVLEEHAGIPHPDKN